MTGIGSANGMISTYNSNLSLLRKTSAHLNKKSHLFDTDKLKSKITITNKSKVSLSELKDIHSMRVENLKYNIFLIALVPWALFVMWMMGLIG